MIEPATYDFTFRPGTFGALGAVIVQFLGADGNPSQLDGVELTLVATSGPFRLEKRTDDGSMSFDEPSATLNWAPTQAETTAICALETPATYVITIYFPDGSGIEILEGSFLEAA